MALVEGETEEAYLEALSPRLGIDLDALGVSVISVSGEGNYGPYLKYLKALSIPCRCQRDKYPKGIAEEWKPLFTYTDSEFEDYMKVNGFGQLLDQAKAQVGDSKARKGRFCGEQIDLDKVPPKHREFLDLIAKLPTR